MLTDAPIADVLGVSENRSYCRGHNQDQCKGLIPRSVVPDPRVEDRVGDVDEEIGQGHEDSDQKRHGHNRGEVIIPDRFDGVLTDPVEIEDRLDHDRTSGKVPKIDPQQGNRGDRS